MDQFGDAVVAASIFDATVGLDRASVYVATATPDGAWSAQQRITDPAVPVDAYATRVAVSPDGLLAIVGWIDHYHGTVHVSRFTAGAWSNATTIGRGTAFSSFSSTDDVLDARDGFGSLVSSCGSSICCITPTTSPTCVHLPPIIWRPCVAG
jgi:hypothetical protein